MFSGELISFAVIAFLLIFSALGVVFMRNIVHSVLFLAATFVLMAVTYLMLDAGFLAGVQLVVYAGAVSIMVVFAVMLTKRSDLHETNLFNRQTVPGAILSLLIFLGLSWVLVKTPWNLADHPQVDPMAINKIADLMFGKFVIPFEVAAILLLVALIGAIILALEVKPQK
ncbi:NADH-quinone oxidoreductase subunit J family protein [Carboxydothermus pertinax]|uniref:NADH-quinone oxidoreductase subunit J n=1 Tax=Carboxydothermus pertinax TaxID=870242 RepID=A0A1L8CXK2_9THEO|nr:NADH-quinone oxidoreductase subunit J [Carboxydothermus pertinax]GAV23662.1 proton-translocating NADH-quinone oxidoreductase subunit J [Carboxydothermus pertinax]